jgi:uncharacterized protein (DUF2141 family)
MKTFFNTVVLFVLFFSTTTILNGQNVNLTIKITGIEKIAGKMEVGLYNNADNFPKDNKAYKKASLTVNANTLTYTFSVPPGNYAVAIFQDENSDGEMNKNFLGIPQEKFGFSNNVKPLFRAPSFADTKINLTKDMTTEIKLISY